MFQVINDHFLWFSCHCSHHIFVKKKKSINALWLKQQQSKEMVLNYDIA